MLHNHLSIPLHDWFLLENSSQQSIIIRDTMEGIASSSLKEKFRIREKLIKIKAKPKSVSYGYSLGVFLGTTPFIGIKVFIALIVTSLFRWNKTASVIGVYHINFLTAPLFYGFSFLVGKWILGTSVVFIWPETISFSAFYEAFFDSMMIFYSLLVGGIVLGLPMAVGAYFLSMAILRRNGDTQQLQFQGPPDTSILVPTGTDSHTASDIRHPVSTNDILSEPLYTLITGASCGLGREMAIECAERGMNLILVALPGRNLDVLCDVLEEEYLIRAEYVEIDLADRDLIVGLVEDLLSKYRINFLINNAGTGGTMPFEESSVEYLEQIIKVNITAVSLLTRLLLPEIQQHPEAYILNISSMAAFSPFPYKTTYAASKSFVSNFSKSLAQELKDSHVKVSVLHPGPIMTNSDATVRIIKLGANGSRGLMPARKLAQIGISGVQRGKLTIVPGMGNIVNWLMLTKLPQMVVLRVLTRVIEKEVKQKKQSVA